MTGIQNDQGGARGSHSDVKIPEPDRPAAPHIVSAREGVPVRLPGCDGLVLRVVHPVNPKAPSKNMGVQLFCLPPQGVLQPGSHETEEVYVILRGEGTMTFAQGEHQEVQEGDFIHLPPWCEHGVQNRGRISLEILICTAPPNP